MATKIKKDGRTILTGRDYTKHKLEIWESQGRCCASCGLYLSFSDAHFDHQKGEGLEAASAMI